MYVRVDVYALLSHVDVYAVATTSVGWVALAILLGFLSDCPPVHTQAR